MLKQFLHHKLFLTIAFIILIIYLPILCFYIVLKLSPPTDLVKCFGNCDYYISKNKSDYYLQGACAFNLGRVYKYREIKSKKLVYLVLEPEDSSEKIKYMIVNYGDNICLKYSTLDTIDSTNIVLFNVRAMSNADKKIFSEIDKFVVLNDRYYDRNSN